MSIGVNENRLMFLLFEQLSVTSGRPQLGIVSPSVLL